MHDETNAQCEPWSPIKGQFMEKEAKKLTAVELGELSHLSNIQEFIQQLQTPLNTTAVDLPSSIECTHANELFGCLNGVPYDWNVRFVLFWFVN